MVAACKEALETSQSLNPALAFGFLALQVLAGGGRCAPAVWPIRIAAVKGPHPVSASNSGRWAVQ